MTLPRCLFALAAAANLIAQGNPLWRQPFPPHRVVGNVYYVGSADLASFLVTTPEGHILINSNFEDTVPLIRQSVEKLGFRFQDIKILLGSHAHADHMGGHALVKQLTGARVLVMEGDAGALAGGQSGKACPVDQVLHDGDQVRLGGVTLVAVLTAGHTRGCTTWTLRAEEAGKTHHVVIWGSTTVLPQYRLVDNPTYPGIAQDYERTFQVLRKLPCDVFLASHGSVYRLKEKFDRLGQAPGNPFVDPEGYRAYLDEAEKAYRERLEAERKGR